MPGAVARTSTTALTNATFPYVLEIAKKGYAHAARKNPAVASGLNIVRGRVTYADLATQYGKPLATLTEVL
jgi:alanine dehydrogenase